MFKYDLNGLTIGKLKVVGNCPEKFGKRTKWKCRCQCGAVLYVRQESLLTAKTKSCGCSSHQMAAEQQRVHGLADSPEYDAWTNMKGRCNRPDHQSYRRYGAKGITVCDRWQKSFVDFYADMGPRPSNKHSIDRINNKGNYEPGNCRWATDTEQAHNQDKFVLLEFNGKVQSLADWAKETGITRNTIYGRLYVGWSVKDALTTPICKNGIHRSKLKNQETFGL